jgi:hypothetical protein
MVLDQDQSRTPTLEIESAQDFDFVTLDVDRDEVDRRRRADLFEHLVERARAGTSIAP